MIRACKHGHTDLKCTNSDQDIYFCKTCGTTIQFYYTMALGLPSWLTQQRGEVPAQLKIRKTVGEIVDGRFNEKKGEFEKGSRGDEDDVITPDGEDVYLFAIKTGYYCNLTAQDLGRFREWREYGGPKYDAERKVNSRRGELMVIGTIDVLEGKIPDQPKWEIKQVASREDAIERLRAELARLEAK